ncbi:MAG: dUTP diphosphatase [Dehalococcoidia bacterium]|nr:dUTP diphosphatase [Dehalococcoidia bacterium]|tara:strand:- start:647 stop:1078 length:432 start_codon:yes stop_codon:yes gene_type:complete
MDEIDIRLLREGGRLPEKASANASGYDLYACLPDAPVRVGNFPVRIPTGLAFAVPPGLDVQIRPRSGLASQGILSSFGTLDADYRGELFISMYTLNPEVSHVVEHGDRVAQLVITHLAAVNFVLREELSKTQRGAGGHGSTGR